MQESKLEVTEVVSLAKQNGGKSFPCIKSTLLLSTLILKFEQVDLQKLLNYKYCNQFNLAKTV